MENSSIVKNDILPVPPRYEICRTRCNTGHENPLINYNKNFTNFTKDTFYKKFKVSEETKDLIKEENLHKKDKMKLCCKSTLVSGVVFSISSKSEKNITIGKKQVFSLPGPLSDADTLSWI